MQAQKVDEINERQKAHVKYFLKRLSYWGSVKGGSWTVRRLAARDADERHPLRAEEKANAVLCYLSNPEARPFDA